MIVSPISGSVLSRETVPTSGCAAACAACTANVPTLSDASRFHEPSATTISPTHALYEIVRESPIAAAITLLPATSCHWPSTSGPTDSLVTESHTLTSTVAPLSTTVRVQSLTEGSLTGATFSSGAPLELSAPPTPPQALSPMTKQITTKPPTKLLAVLYMPITLSFANSWTESKHLAQ